MGEIYYQIKSLSDILNLLIKSSSIIDKYSSLWDFQNIWLSRFTISNVENILFFLDGAGKSFWNLRYLVISK